MDFFSAVAELVEEVTCCCLSRIDMFMEFFSAIIVFVEKVTRCCLSRMNFLICFSRCTFQGFSDTAMLPLEILSHVDQGSFTIRPLFFNGISYGTDILIACSP